MTDDLARLFAGECIAVFEFEDGSLIVSKVTLNQEILKKNNVDHLDGLVDLDLKKVIPKYMFEYFIGFEDLNFLDKLNPIHKFFNLGGKVSW